MRCGKISISYDKQLPGINSNALYNTNRPKLRASFKKFILGFTQPNKMIPNQDVNVSLLPMCSIDSLKVEMCTLGNAITHT